MRLLNEKHTWVQIWVDWMSIWFIYCDTFIWSKTHSRLRYWKTKNKTQDVLNIILLPSTVNDKWPLNHVAILHSLLWRIIQTRNISFGTYNIFRCWSNLNFDLNNTTAPLLMRWIILLLHPVSGNKLNCICLFLYLLHGSRTCQLLASNPVSSLSIKLWWNCLVLYSSYCACLVTL